MRPHSVSFTSTQGANSTIEPKPGVAQRPLMSRLVCASDDRAMTPGAATARSTSETAFTAPDAIPLFRCLRAATLAKRAR